MSSNEIKELEVLFDNMHEGMVVQDPQDKIIKYNLQACEILGLTPNQLLGKDSMDPSWKAIKEDGSLYDGNEHPSVVCMRTGLPQYNKIMGVRRPAGDYRWILINSSPIFAEGLKTPVKTITTFHDITTEQSLKKQLELQNFRMEVAIEALEFGIWDWDITNNILVWDKYMYQMFGADKNDFNGAYEAFEACLDPNDKDRVRQNVEESISRGNQIFESEFHIIRPIDKKRRLIKAVSKILRTEGIIRMIGVKYDLTEERQAEAMIQQTAKLCSLGEMAAGVAHEINNPLAIISGRVTQIEKIIKSDEIDKSKLSDYLNSIKTTTQRIASIVQGMKSFSRDGAKDSIEKINLITVIKETLSFCQGRLGDLEIKVIFLPVEEKIFIQGRATDLSQVILNILNNSIDAISHIDEKWIKIEIISLLDSVEVIMTDSGPGINSEISDKIFDPFFTTKEVGKGTGLGLSISKNLILRNGGDLKLNKESATTSFILSLKKA